MFDNKNFNEKVFESYKERVPNTRRNKMIEVGVLTTDSKLASKMADETGGNYLVRPLKGLIEGSTKNYDGATNITSNGSTTYEQGVVVVGRADAWTEKDFSYDITGGVDFMQNVAEQVGMYWDTVDQDTILAILEGIFKMTGALNTPFVTNHTMDISGGTNEAALVSATTLNKTMQKACGQNKGNFALAIMHSEVATNLENLNVLEYLKYTDSQGMTRDLTMGTWNGRLVIVDDSMPVEVTGDVGSEVTKYTTYVLGRGMIDYANCGVKVPSEMDRNPAINGGEDTLYSRQRKIFAPYGISFTKASMASKSPTDAELKTATNWELVKDATGKKTIDHKAIAIARIISKG